MKPPPVTVVVPALDAEEWIGACLGSVVGQTYPREALEIIVIDDGSADGTVAEALRVLAPSGIAHAVLHNASPQGPSAARNRGWQAGRAQWVQFLDADDLLEQSKIEIQVRAASALDPRVAAVFSPWGRLVHQDGVWVPQSVTNPVIGADPLADVLRTENFMQLGSLLFARAWLSNTGGFVESYSLIEDVDLLMRIVVQGGVLRGVPFAGALSWYRQRTGSLSRTDNGRFIDGCLRNARFAEAHWTRTGELTPAQASVLSDVYFMAARYYAERDSAAFRALAADLNRLEPGFAPKGPPALRLLTKIVGYTRAERCAVRYRRVKRTVRFQ